MTDPTPKPKTPRTLTELLGTEQSERAATWDRLARENPSWTQAEVDAAEQREFERGRARNLVASRQSRRGKAGVGSQMLQGATFGFSDELMGLGDAVEDKLLRGDRRPFGEVYADRRDAERERQHEFTDRRPGTALVAQLAGGLLTGGGVVRSAAKAAPSVVGQAVRGAGAGAAAGAVGGVGASEATSGDRLLTDAIEGGVLGGIAGGAAPALVAGARSAGGRALRPLRDAARKFAREGAQPAVAEAPPMPTDAPRRLMDAADAPVTPRTPQRLMDPSEVPAPRASTPADPRRLIDPAATPEVQPSGPAPTLLRRLAARFAGQAPDDSGWKDGSFLRLGKALRDDGVDPQELAERGAAAAGSSARSSEVIADLAGDQVRRVVRGSEAVPSAGASKIRETLRERQAAQGNRVAQVILRAFGMDEAPDLVAAARSLQSARRAASRPAYEAAFGPPESPTMIPRSMLTPYLEQPEFAAALREGMRQARLDRATGELLSDGPWLREAVTDVLEDGTPIVELGEQVPLQIVDYLKRGLDAVIERGVRGNSLDRTRVRSLKQLRDQLLTAVDEAVPEYRAARRIYQGGSEEIAALEAGQEAMRRKVTRAQMRSELDGLSDEAAEQYRLGALGALLEDAANVADGRDVLATIQRNPAMREKLQLLVPDDNGRKLLQDLVESEGRQTATRRVIEGSRTAPLLEDIAALDEGSPVATVREGMRQGNATVTGIGLRVGDAIVDRLMRARRNALADELGPLLMEPAARAPLLARRIAAAEQRAAQRARTAQAGATGVGTSAGQAVGDRRRP